MMQPPVFDDFDAGILAERQRGRYALEDVYTHPCIGDFVLNKDGLFARVAHVWEDGIQTTDFSKNGENGSFSVGTGGRMSYSGGLQSSIPLKYFKHKNGLRKDANVWFFHHSEAKAHNAVYCKMSVRVFSIIDESEIVDESIQKRYVISKENFNGQIYSYTFTTMDGIERVGYSKNIPLSDFIKENDSFIIISEDELNKLMQRGK